VVESWFLRAPFWGVKIFLDFKIYFWAVAISRMVRGKDERKGRRGERKGRQGILGEMALDVLENALRALR
jgi:hypothetical protein